MKKNDIEIITGWYKENNRKELDLRHLTLAHLQPYLEALKTPFKVTKIGESHKGRNIYKVKMGKGDTKVLLWTQMHGNESTGTRAFLDLVQFFANPGKMSWLADHILEHCTLYGIPMLNPDGAQVYTRVNAQNIDLNRDVIDLKAVESQILMQNLTEINPEYCFNLHDQRTIFSVPPENQPATISFLAPSVDKERTLTAGRKDTMRVIVAMNNLAQQLIPGRVGRYTDEFYPTATGDNFQKMGHNTILIESGHSQGDYLRKESRKITFFTLLEGLRYISMHTERISHKPYFEIPNNEKKYLDVIVKNTKVKGIHTDIGIQFVEKLKDKILYFEPSIDQMGKLDGFRADKVIDGQDLDFNTKKDAETWVKNSIN